MKILPQIPLVALLAPLLLFAQSEDARFDALRAKHQRGEKLTFEEEDYVQSTTERRNQTQSAARQVDWAKAHAAKESTGLVPLPDLGAGLYQGEKGGLYPDGAKALPQAHEDAGLALAKS